MAALTLRRVGLGGGGAVVEFRCSDGTVIPVPDQFHGMAPSFFDPTTENIWVPYLLPKAALNHAVDTRQLTPPGSQAGDERVMEWPCRLCLEQGLTEATGLEQFSEQAQMAAHADKHRDPHETQATPIQDLVITCFPDANGFNFQDQATEEVVGGEEEAALENVVQDANDEEQLPTSDAKKRKAKERESAGDEADAPIQKKTKKQLEKKTGKVLGDKSVKGGGKEAKEHDGETKAALVEKGLKKFIVRVDNFYDSKAVLGCSWKNCKAKGARRGREALMLHILNHANAFQFQCTGAICEYQACRRPAVLRHIDAAHHGSEEQKPTAAKVIRPEVSEEGLLQVFAVCFPKAAKNQ